MKIFRANSSFEFANRYPFMMVELLSVLLDVKPAVRSSDLSDTEVDEVIFLCKKYEMDYIVSKKVPKIVGDVKSKDFNINFIYVSKNRELLDELVSADIKGDCRRIGELLGYPKCCVDFNIRIMESFSPREENIPLETFVVSDSFDFELNNLLPIKYISHFPCSYSCKKSLEYVKDLRKKLKEFDSVYDKKISENLSGIFLFVRKYVDGNFKEFVIRFIGKKNDYTVSYSDYTFYGDESLVSKELISCLSRNKQFLFDNGKVIIENKEISLDSSLLIEFKN